MNMLLVLVPMDASGEQQRVVDGLSQFHETNDVGAKVGDYNAVFRDLAALCRKIAERTERQGENAIVVSKDGNAVKQDDGRSVEVLSNFGGRSGFNANPGNFGAGRNGFIAHR